MRAILRFVFLTANLKSASNCAAHQFLWASRYNLTMAVLIAVRTIQQQVHTAR